MLKTLEKCAEAESNLAKAYATMSGQFKSNTKARELLLRLSLDKEAYASKIDLAIKIERSEGSSIGEHNIDSAFAEKMLHLSTRILAKSQTKMTLDEVSEIVLLMEGEFNKLRLDAIAKFKPSHLKELFGALSRSDLEHTETLNEFISAFGQN